MSVMCVVDLDCNDGRFCNGTERCAPDDPAGDARGCVPGGAPCPTGLSCDDEGDRCIADCGSDPDADGDGVVAVACGGGDCDDMDPDRYPGNPEICDAEGHDEDCDPTTLGVDDDEDGFVSNACCGPSATGLVCGSDCDDSMRGVGPGAVEVCNGFDEDCDGSIDEGLPSDDWAPDCDGDLFGDALATPTLACAQPIDPPTCEGGEWADNQGDCDDGDPLRQLSCGACAAFDVLVVVDHSVDTAEELALLQSKLPILAERLTTGDRDGDGSPDGEPVRDLRLGVVSSDLGTGDHPVPFCGGVGDDAVLLEDGAATAGCPATSPPYLDYRVGEDDPETFVDDVRCKIAIDTDACGFEQPLDAMLKAVTPASSPIRFRDADLGHGDGANVGFLRPGSTLVVVVVGTEDDCSIADYEELLTHPLDGVTCLVGADALHPVSRYVGGLLSLRPAADLLYGVLGGIPSDLVPAPAAPDFETILADPRMETRVNPSDPSSLAPSCNSPEQGLATPPERLTVTARDLAERGVSPVVGSLCSESAVASFTNALAEAILTRQDDRCGVAP